MSPRTPKSEPIAIVGSSCRFPGPASNISKLWQLLQNPYDISREVPPERFNIDAFYHSDPKHHGTFNTRRAYFLEEDPRVFDASFFQINAREAETMDPQQRILLETVYEALEAGGHSIEKLKGSQTAVFVGGMSCDFRDTIAVRDPMSIPEYSATGTHDSILAARISYFYDWKGPSMSIDTACSSSLVAMHQAVQALRNGEATAAVAAGSNLNLGPEQFVSLSNLRMLSPNGKVRMWDHMADGYARGEGFGAVILKTLSQAEADGDHIECIIRESGVNQDGNTMGITMPNAESQTALIKQVYERAGLKISDPLDQPQYFEAHGTGTPAGDPIEAEAIYRAFLSCRASGGHDEPLQVGSIKTVTGHLEGAAGIAGLLKASLAVQHGIIPPNLHFQTLNPKIEQYYGNMRVPTGGSRPWPAVPDGQPRRASVNSFGFGGTNAHIILESYISPEPALEPMKCLPPVTPLTISAKSKRALARRIDALADYIERSAERVDLEDLAYTLQSRTSQFPLRKAFYSTSCEAMISSMRESLRKPDDFNGRRSDDVTPRILGIFTGQGAQIARMGAALVERSTGARDKLRWLESVLASIPESPSWFLTDELLKAASSSRIREAEVSQPLCTALQIIIVDHLSGAGVKFDCVVGHSSGEIAAAYAAGLVSGRDAICIAYYRGLYSKFAEGPSGEKGSMIATGMSFEHAAAFCGQPQFSGRLCVAASNSPSSSTLSGDELAVEEAKSSLDEKGVFSRKLVVDTAYHSHHMKSVGDVYVQALQDLGIATRSVSRGSIFVSSVFKESPIEYILGPKYWRDNMVRPVLFSHAIQQAVANHGPFDVALEIGPHPALKGPATETLEAAECKLSYHGTLNRDLDSVQAMSEVLGFLYENTKIASHDFEGYRAMLFDANYPTPRLVTGLPSYPWDHDRTLYRESRTSHRYLHNRSPRHDLLGQLLPDDSSRELRWRNVISLETVPWARDHRVQGQAVMAAMWYLAMALEAATYAANDVPIEIVEVSNFRIDKALPMDEGTVTETIFSLTMHKAEGSIQASFACTAGPLHGTGRLELVFSGEITIKLRDSRHQIQDDEFQPRTDTAPGWIQLDTCSFYDYLKVIGYGYEGSFRGLETISKRGTKARSTASNPSSQWLVHPATLDLALQTLLAAHFNQNDENMSLIVPQAFDRFVLYPKRCAVTDWTFDAVVDKESYEGICGDIHISDTHGRAIALIENVSWSPLTVATPANDRKMFYTTVLEPDICHGTLIFVAPYSEHELQIVSACDRVALYYYRSWHDLLGAEEWAAAEPHHRRLLAYIEHLSEEVAEDRILTLRGESDRASWEEIQALLDNYPHSADLGLIRTVGESLPTSIREKRPMLEFMLQDDQLTEYYKRGLGYERCYEILKTMIRRIVHRYPQMHVLEVGAGTGGATRNILDAMGDKFHSYTFTDVSSGFFEKAKETFDGTTRSRMLFKTLDLERDPLEQAFVAGSFDLVIGSLVVHATKSVKSTLQRLRKLLKPGGYLILVEGSEKTLRSGFMMSGLPGWWVGGDDRPWGPMLGLDRWGELLKAAGFSGIDVSARDSELPYTNLGYVFASQAANPTINFLRDPLNPDTLLGGTQLERVTVVGRTGLQEMLSFLDGRVKHISALGRLEEINTSTLPKGTPVILLSDLDKEAFQSLSAEILTGLQELCSTSSRIVIPLWIQEEECAYSQALLGLVRSVRLEIPHLRIQTLGIRSPGRDVSRRIVEALLRIASWPDAAGNELLWSFEPELELMEDQILIPRVIEDIELTERLNSKRRMITQDLNPRETCVETVQYEGHLRLQRPRQFDGITVAKQNSISISFSVMQPFYLGKKPYFLCTGRSKIDGTPVVALAETNCSILNTTAGHHAGPSNNAVMSRWLALVACSLYAQQCTIRSSKSARFVLHDADAALREAFVDTCQCYGRSLPFFSSSSRSKPGFLYIPTHASRRQVQELLFRITPEQVFYCIDCVDCGVSALIKASLPGTICLKLFGDPPVGGEESSKWSGLDSALQQAIGFASAQLESAEDLAISFDVCSASDLDSVQINHPGCGVPLIDWTAAHNVPVAVRSVTETFNLFYSHKTYLLVGLTGDMGKTLADWMVAQGARYIALASRNPQIDNAWFNDHEKRGSVIKIYTMDVCHRHAVQSTRDAIAADGLPPVGGVANGAMVLRDSSFYEMTNEQMMECLRPKVEGSRNLSTVFEDLPLDFFVMFSSLAYTLGNPGQSNYAAANGFMEGFARERRARGQAASVISLGVVGGVGYLARTKDGKESDHARKRNVLTIMPEELCDIFAEAVVAGRCSGEHAVEVITGLDGRIDSRLTAKESLASWLSDPRMSHIIADKALESHQVGLSVAKADTVSLRVQLSSVEGESAAVAALKHAFLSKLGRMSLVSAGGVPPGSIPLTELGVDSLLAIEIRSWFMTELGVDMPVLKVLGGSTISAIVQHAVRAFQSISPPISATEDQRQSSSSESGIDTPSTNDEAQVVQPRRQVATFSQGRMYRLHQFTRGAAHVNNMSWSYNILGALDVARLELALQTVLRPLESLRTRFTIDGKRIMQEVMPFSALRVDVVGVVNEGETNHVFCSLADTVHDPSSGHLVRAVLAKVSITEHVLMMSFHHIGIDTRSCEILLADLDRAYALPYNFISSYHQAPTHPVDLAVLETENLTSSGWAASVDFWKDHLAGANLTLPLFSCARTKARRAMTDFHLSSHFEYLSTHQMEDIRNLCRAWKCSPYHVHTAVFAILLHQLTGLKDVIIGSVDAGRDTHPSFAEAFGPMFNYLPLHLRDICLPSNADGGQLVDTVDVQYRYFKDLIRRVRNTTYAVRTHALVPFDVIVDAVGEQRMPATHHPVYQAQINYLKHTLEEIPLGSELTMRLRDARGVAVSYDFCVSVLEGREGARIAFQTQEYLYGPEQVMMLGTMYMRMLREVLSYCHHGIVHTPSET